MPVLQLVEAPRETGAWEIRALQNPLERPPVTFDDERQHVVTPGTDELLRIAVGAPQMGFDLFRVVLATRRGTDVGDDGERLEDALRDALLEDEPRAAANLLLTASMYVLQRIELRHRETGSIVYLSRLGSVDVRGKSEGSEKIVKDLVDLVQKTLDR